MKEPVFMDKLGFCQQLSMRSAVFMDKQTDGAFEATCHPRLGVPPKEAGVAGTHRLSVFWIELLLFTLSL